MMLGGKKSSRKSRDKDSKDKSGSKGSSTIDYIHKSLQESLVNGKKSVNDEKIISGSKGLTIVYFNKQDDKVEKIYVSGSGDKYVVKMTKNGATEEKEMSKSDLKKMLKDNKNLKFAYNYFETQKGGALLDFYGGKPRKSSKKSSKKSKAEVSEMPMPMPKKRSRKGSKKGSKKSSKKGSKKASKKGSKKSSKKRGSKKY